MEWAAPFSDEPMYVSNLIYMKIIRHIHRLWDCPDIQGLISENLEKGKFLKDLERTWIHSDLSSMWVWFKF